MMRTSRLLSALLVCGGCSNSISEEAGDDRPTPVAEPGPSAPAEPGPIAPIDPGPVDPIDPGVDPVDEPDPEPVVDPVEPDPTAPCRYPSTAGGFRQTGDVIPALSWDHARLGGGATTTFDLEDFHCADDGTTGLVLLLSAGWCGNCPSYMRDLAPDVTALEARGLRVALVLLENNNSQPASDDDADAYADQYFGGNVVRLGDADTSPARALYDSSIWSSFPGALVVRKSDMRVIANQDDQGQTLDFLRLADDLADGAGTPTPPASDCTEEAGEPNDVVAQATAVTTTASAAICDGAPDHWQVDGAGSFTVTVRFTHAAGDLDLRAVDASGRELSRSEGTTDTERLTITAPGRVAVYGYGGATGAYTLEVTR